MSVHQGTPAEDQGRYSKRGARIKSELRARITEVEVAAEPVKPHPDAYKLAMANLHKPWARRYLRRYSGYCGYYMPPSIG